MGTVSGHPCILFDAITSSYSRSIVLSSFVMPACIARASVSHWSDSQRRGDYLREKGGVF
jgi:hypothetical protein